MIFPTRRTGRAARIVARLVLGLAVGTAMFAILLSVTNAGAAFFGAWAVALFAIVCVDDRSHRRKVEAARRDRLRASAQCTGGES